MSAPRNVPAAFQGEGRAAGAPGCQYAACGRPATAQADGWSFCGTHLHEHEALQRDDDRAFTSKPGFGWIRKACGTPAAYTRHHRRGEQPCDLCTEAHARERNQLRGRGYVSTSQKRWSS